MMPLRKKIRLSSEIDEAENVNLTNEQLHLLNNVKTASLNSLPDEILLYIFNMLCPVDIVSLESTKCERIASVTQVIRKAGFHLCRDVSPSCVSDFFKSSRVRYIKEINLNNTYYVSPTLLEKMIFKCKNLEILSVMNCGLTFLNVKNILLKGTLIKEFSWDAKADLKEYKKTDCIAPHVKKLHLDLLNLHIPTLISVLSLCPSVEDLKIHFKFSGSFVAVEQTWLEKANEILIPNVHSLIITVNDSIKHVQYILIQTFKFVQLFVHQSSCHFKKLWIDNILYRIDRIFNVQLKFYDPSCLHLNGENEAIDILSSISRDNLKVLSIVLKVDLPDGLVETINYVAGKKLKYLALHTESSFIEPVISLPKNLERILHFCCNITTLNLANMHFISDTSLMLLAVGNLKYVSRISLSSCSVQTFDGNNSMASTFEDMICRTALVEYFSLIGCECKQGPSDSDMNAIYKWKCLQHLVLTGVKTLRLCSFLMSVANHCAHLKSLQLIDVGNSAVCHFTQHINHVLKKAKKFMFLRINQESFYPSDRNFWKAVAMAKNLEGICLGTRISCHLDSKMILRSLSQLKNLNLCHFHFRDDPGTLFAKLRQMMNKNKIRRQKIDIHYGLEMLYCCNSHFNIPLPNDCP